MSTPAEIAAAVTASRGEFSNIFLLAQEGPILFGNRKPFEALMPSADDRQAFEQAATYARENGFDTALVNELIKAQRENGALLTARMAAAPDDSPLQAIHKTAQGFFDPLTVARGLLNGTQCSANVIIDGDSAGTGVLIEPHLVLTAWHVVRPLFHLDAGVWKCDDKQSHRLRIDFDVAALSEGQSQTVPRPLSVDADDAWCSIFVACHDEEAHNRLPADPTELEYKWDFAVIRLKQAFGKQRYCATLDDHIPIPRATDKIYVFQYPKGNVLRYHDHEIYEPELAWRAAVPRLRFLHTASTDHGSSGGPCFDKEFHLFGLHQGVWTNGPAGKVVNRGIPITRIHEAIRKASERLPSVNPIWSLEDVLKSAVIGCDPFQAEVWATARSDGMPILSISGEPGTGKTLRVDVADLLLAEKDHLKIVVESPTSVALGAEAFARELCHLGGTTLPTLTPPDRVNSTLPLWLKQDLVPAIVKALGAARQTRTVWLMLKDLNRCATFGEGTSEVLYLLYQQVLTNPWLRFVLDGMQGNISQDLIGVMRFHPVSKISEEDILIYLQRRTNELRLDPATLGLPTRARGLHRSYMQQWNDPVKQGSAAKELAYRVSETIGDDLTTAGY